MDYIRERLSKLKRTKVYHVFLCGLRGAGKSLLLYKTILPGWEHAAAEIEPTVYYHYEEYKRGNKVLGIWDFTGDSKLRDIPRFVCSQIHVFALVFVVNAMDTSDVNNYEIMTFMNSLLQEQSKENSLVILLFNGNSKEMLDEKVAQFQSYIDHLKHRYSPNFSLVRVNAARGLDDPEWQRILDFIAATDQWRGSENQSVIGACKRNSAGVIEEFMVRCGGIPTLFKCRSSEHPLPTAVQVVKSNTVVSLKSIGKFSRVLTAYPALNGAYRDLFKYYNPKSVTLSSLMTRVDNVRLPDNAPLNRAKVKAKSQAKMDIDELKMKIFKIFESEEGKEGVQIKRLIQLTGQPMQNIKAAVEEIAVQKKQVVIIKLKLI
ncbi:bifunctional Small GTPase superfamily [Babesia duncani]|uniref:Bifunctional Small GTPase superfamily n=1 Tax=Babesia duncani TaxID=323732 RepID=A0AAD9PJ70_9APIC|nr:bifunctional Small GTPase superfamily [Babesia duncani]